MEKEELLKQKSIEVLEDFKRQYFEETFQVFSPEKLKELGYNFDYEVWKIFIDVPDEQFGGQSPFYIYFKNETMEPFMFHDGGAEGRVPDLAIIKKDGKYEIGNEWTDE